MKSYLKHLSVVLLAVLIASCTSSVKKNDVINLLPVRTGQVFRYIDTEGKIIINPQFKEAGLFRNGLALVQVFGSKPMWGFITKEGTFALRARYKEATVFSEEIAWVVPENGAPEAINVKGDSLFTIKAAKSVRIFHNGLAAFSVSADSVSVKWGFVDTKGNVKIAPQFSATGDFSDGKCAVANSAGEWGYIDTEGNVSINYQYTRANGFVDGKAIVQSGKECGVIDEKGKFVINPLFSEMKADSPEYIIKQNNKWGWCDGSGTITIDPQFGEAYPFNGNELAPVKLGNKFGFVDRKGKLIIDAQFDAALPFNGKIAWVVSKGKGGFIDKDAKYIIQPLHDAVSEDLKAYLQTGTSAYESVNTDYFDVDAIVNRLKNDITESTVAGLSYKSPMSLIYRKYKKSEADFIKNASEHKIISAERISNDATLDFFLLGTPWSEAYNGKMGFSYTLKPNYTHTGFSYRFMLTGKGAGNEGQVLRLLETALKGYSKDEKHSNADVTILQSRFQLLVGLKQKGMIIVAVYPLTPENLQMIDLNYGDGTGPDSTTLASDSAAAK
ncbi:MAG: WG repeat-containing protein [Bacteroidota bacterium]|nr:WG repeat-containing protein [Bacteroidota bacterium]